MKKLTAIVMGYGMRGQGYTHYSVDHPDQLQIVQFYLNDENYTLQLQPQLQLVLDNKEN